VGQLAKLPGLVAQTSQSRRAARPRIVGRIDETRFETLRGNTRPEANLENAGDPSTWAGAGGAPFGRFRAS
jgi:hypothetical protein